MPRPSRNQDRALLAAGRELLPVVGCSGLTIRQVSQAAGVNPGMFHYHFRTREAFLRAVMQSAYEEMFAQLTLVAPRGARPRATATAFLRSALAVLGRFVLGHRALIARILADALGGEAVARDFLRENFPRHLRVILGLVAAAQAAGELRPMPPVQAFGFCAGAIAMPVLVGGALAEGSLLEDGLAGEFRAALLTPEALEERLDLALAALAMPRPRPGARR